MFARIRGSGAYQPSMAARSSAVTISRVSSSWFCKAWISEPGAFDQAVSRLWSDCHVAGAREFEFALAQLGTEHLVFGTNFGGWDKGTSPDVTDLRGTLNANAIRLYESIGFSLRTKLHFLAIARAD